MGMEKNGFGTEKKMPANVAALASRHPSSPSQQQQQQQAQQKQQPGKIPLLPQVVEPGAPILTKHSTTAGLSREHAAHHPHSPGRPASNVVVLDAEEAAEQARQRIQKAKKRRSKAHRPLPLGVGLGVDDTSSSMDTDLLSQNQNSISSWNDSSGAKGTANSSDFSLQDKKLHAGIHHHGAVARGSNDPDWTVTKDPRARAAAAAAAADRSIPQHGGQQNSYTNTSATSSPDRNRRESYNEMAAAKDPGRRISAALHRLQDQQRGTGSVAIPMAVKNGKFEHSGLQWNNEPNSDLKGGKRTEPDTSMLILNNNGKDNSKTTSIEDFKTSPLVGALAIDPSVLESGGRADVERPEEVEEIMDAPVVLADAVSPPIEIETIEPSPNISGGLVTARPVTDPDEGGVDQDAEREQIEFLERQKRELEERMEAERRAAIPAQLFTGEETDEGQGVSKEGGELEKEENKSRFSRRFLYGIVVVVIVVIVVVIAAVVSSSSPSTPATTSPTLSPSIMLPPTTSPPTVMPTISMAPTAKVLKKFLTNAELITAVDSYLTNSGPNTTLADTYGYPIGNWDVSQMTDFSNVFSADRNSNMQTFTADLSRWNVGNGQVFSNMFKNANAFQSDLSLWDTSKATYLDGMFFQASSFKSDLSRWQTSKVTSMSMMFVGATSFNSDLSRWDTSSVSIMSGMFWLASSFSSNLSAWNVGNVENMYNMFVGASNFTSDLSGWNVLRVRSIKEMFKDATKFSSNLCSWGTQLVSVDVTNMFVNTACPNTTDPNLTTKTPFCYNCNSN